MNELIKERLANIRKNLDHQIILDDPDSYAMVNVQETLDIILLIDNFLGWDYDIK